MAKITQNISNGIGNNNIVQFNTNDAADSGYAIAVLNIIIGSYEPNDSEDPTKVVFLSTHEIRSMVLLAVGVELPLDIIYTALIQAGFVARLVEQPALTKGIYFSAIKQITK